MVSKVNILDAAYVWSAIQTAQSKVGEDTPMCNINNAIVVKMTTKRTAVPSNAEPQSNEDLYIDSALTFLKENIHAARAAFFKNTLDKIMEFGQNLSLDNDKEPDSVPFFHDEISNQFPSEEKIANLVERFQAAVPSV